MPQLNYHQVIAFIVIATFLIAPGIFVLFLFHREIFLELENLKLILLSIAITAPFFFVNFFPCAALASHYHADRSVNNDDLIILYALSVNCIVIYLASLIGFFREYTFSGVLLVATVLQIIAGLILYTWSVRLPK